MRGAGVPLGHEAAGRAWNGPVPAELSEKRRRAGRLGAAARWRNRHDASGDGSRPGTVPVPVLRHHPQAVPDRQWYRIENQADGDTAQVWIYDEIGYWGVTAGDFIDELKAITAPNIELHVNTPGGDVFDGIAIYNALLTHPADVTVYVDALAASAGSFIVQAGNRRIMARNSQMMIHEAAGLCIGCADDMRQMGEMLDRQSDNIASIYKDRAGGGLKSWRAAMKAETWYSASEAVEAGLADEVMPMPPMPMHPDEEEDDRARAHWDLSIFRHAGRDNAPAPVIENTKQGAGDDGPASGGDAAPSGDGAGGHDAGRTGPEPAPTIDLGDVELDTDVIRASLADALTEAFEFDPDAFRAAVDEAANNAPAPPTLAPRRSDPPDHLDVNTFATALKEALQ